MAYEDFTLESVATAFGLNDYLGDLFPGLIAEPVPPWVIETIDRGRRHMALLTEKARSEALVVPILLACVDHEPDGLSMYSGQRMDVDPSRGLTGECDFILASTPLSMRLKAPILIVLEAKRGDIEAGIGQCVAQAVGARLFNEKAGEARPTIFGCVTTGDEWQFFRLQESEVVIDRVLRFRADIGIILAAVRECIHVSRSVTAAG